jgi:hypothetical protein
VGEKNAWSASPTRCPALGLPPRPPPRQAVALIGTRDDATGATLSAFFVAQEGTASSFRGLRETIERPACSPVSIPTAAAARCRTRGPRVGGDNCVRYEGRSLQIPEQKHRRHFVRANVSVHEYPGGAIAIFRGPREIARFGAPEKEEVAPRPAARSKAPCSRPSRPKEDFGPAGGAGAPALTAAARDAPTKMQAGTKKRRSQPNQETNPPPA